MAPVGVGVIGCGYWGPKLIRNFYDLATAQVRMVAELQPERRGQLERQFPGVQTTANHDDVLADPAIEAVVIATPVRTHYTLAQQALAGGKHVLVEKPLAASMAEAAELVALSEERNLCLMVGHTFEYNPAVEELRRLVQSETLGKIHYIDTARLNLGLFQQDINVMWDLAPHDISILLYLLNMDPLTVSARGNGCVRPSIYDVVYLELCFPGNITAHVHVSWLEPCKVRRVTVVGDRKMAVYNDVAVEEKIKIYDKGVSLPATPGVPGEFQMSYRYGDIVSPRVVWQEPLRVECSHFVDCIRTARRARSDGRAGWRVVRILERAEQSLTHGGLRIGVADGYADLPAALVGGSGNGHVPQPHLAPSGWQ
jgi:predicted dehydrogenase